MQGKSNVQALAAALLIAVLPFETMHLLFVCLGAVGYLLLQSVIAHDVRGQPKHSGCDELSEPPSPPRGSRPWQPSSPVHAAARRTSYEKPKVARTVAPPESPKFIGVRFEDEVAELLQQITPARTCEAVVAAIVRKIKLSMQRSFPDVEVSGFVNGNLRAGRAFAVAVPDVELVLTISEAALRERHADSSGDELQSLKWALRTCTDRLVNALGFKFRRSAFKGREPRVTLLAPAYGSRQEEAVPVDLSVNAMTPLNHAVLLSELEHVSPAAKGLAMLVRRWAKDRGVCHVTKGHLSPYAWTVLCMHYLQNGEAATPCPASFEPEAALRRLRERKEHHSRADVDAELAVALFKGFLHFYAEVFDWKNDTIVLVAGQTLQTESAGGPRIIDPFRPTSNLGEGTTEDSLARLREELARAHALCAKGASLSLLLEPWKPAWLEGESGEATSK